MKIKRVDNCPLFEQQLSNFKIEQCNNKPITNRFVMLTQYLCKLIHTYDKDTGNIYKERSFQIIVPDLLRVRNKYSFLIIRSFEADDDPN